MTITFAEQLGAVSHRLQRQLLVALFRRNPRDDTPIDSDEFELEDGDLEILFDYQHYHLPDLESKGLIDYDREDHSVTKGPLFEEIKPLIELIDEHKDELPPDWL